MRIHSDIIITADLIAATQIASAGGHGHVYRETTTHGSRKRDRAFEVRLTGDGIVKGNRTMDGEDYAATWDAWGWFLGHLFTVDPNMVAGADDGADAFNSRTGHAFTADNLPDVESPAPVPAATWADGHGVWHVKVLTDLTRGEAAGWNRGRTERPVNIKGVASRALKQELTSRDYHADSRCWTSPVKVGTDGAYTIFRERVPSYV